MSKVEFDAEFVERYAESLYDNAPRMAVQYVLVGGFVGLVTGIAAFGVMHPAAIGTFVVVGAAGYVVGNDRARQMRLDAQLALCQLTVEENTRKWLDQLRAERTATRTGRTLADPPTTVAPTIIASRTVAPMTPVASENTPLARNATPTWNSELHEPEEAETRAPVPLAKTVNSELEEAEELHRAWAPASEEV